MLEWLSLKNTRGGGEEADEPQLTHSFILVKIYAVSVAIQVIQVQVQVQGKASTSSCSTLITLSIYLNHP